MPENLREDVKQNTADIKELVQQVTRVATLVESAEKRHEQDMSVLRELFEKVNGLNQRMGATIGLEKDIAAIRETTIEIKGKLEAETRTLRHDLNTALNVQQAVPIHGQKITRLETEVAALNKWKDEFTGAAKASGAWVKTIWAVLGTAVLALGGFLAKIFFTHGGDNGGF